MAQELSDLWANLKTENIWESWFGGVANGLIFKSSLLNNTAMLPFLQSVVEGKEM